MYKLKLLIGICVGLLVALLLWNWKLSLAMGAGLILVWFLLRKSDKILSCFLASCLGVIPILADDYYAGYNGAQCYCFEPAAVEPEWSSTPSPWTSSWKPTTWARFNRASSACVIPLSWWTTIRSTLPWPRGASI